MGLAEVVDQDEVPAFGKGPGIVRGGPVVVRVEAVRFSAGVVVPGQVIGKPVDDQAAFQARLGGEDDVLPVDRACLQFDHGVVVGRISEPF